MSDKVDVFMPLFLGDYRKDTLDLTAEEHGAYLLLLMEMWNRGGELPNDHNKLPRVACVDPARWIDVWSGIDRFFTVTVEGKLTQKRLRTELEKAVGRRRRASDAGKASAAQRNGNGSVNGTATEHPTERQPESNSSHPHSQVTERSDPPKPPEGGAVEDGEFSYPEAFLGLWALFPKIRGTKHKAFRAWSQLRPRPRPDVIAAGIEAWKRCPDWTKEGGKYTPAMSVWLNNRGWETEPPGITRGPSSPARTGPLLCPFHGDYRTAGKPSKYPKPETCSECKHVAARSRPRIEGEPTSLEALMGGKA